MPAHNAPFGEFSNASCQPCRISNRATLRQWHTSSCVRSLTRQPCCRPALPPCRPPKSSSLRITQLAVCRTAPCLAIASSSCVVIAGCWCWCWCPRAITCSRRRHASAGGGALERNRTLAGISFDIARAFHHNHLDALSTSAATGTSSPCRASSPELPIFTRTPIPVRVRGGRGVTEGSTCHCGALAIAVTRIVLLPLPRVCLHALTKCGCVLCEP